MISLQILALVGSALANSRGLNEGSGSQPKALTNLPHYDGAHSSSAASQVDGETRVLWGGYDPCISYDKWGKCEECKDGYILTKFGECKEEIKHCIEYNFIGECSKCDEGYFEGRGTCHKIIVGCIKYDPWVFNCQKCDQGWFFENKECHREIKNCDRYNKIHWYCEHCLWPYKSVGYACIKW